MAYTVIDVSKYNTVNNYPAAASAIDGVIIRAGYRGYGSSGTLVKDNLFDTHYNGFAGKTKIGIYWFTQAITEAEAIAEANYLYSLIKGKQVDFPIYIDSEYSNNNHNGRADILSKSDRTKYLIAFCERMKELGYRAGVYASDSWYNSNLVLSDILARKYSLWIARYSSSSPTCTKEYDAWQYTSKGAISGVSGNCDISYFYNDIAGWVTTKPDINTYNLNVPTNIFIYTGSEIKPSFSIDGLTANQDYIFTFSNNNNAGTGKCNIVGVNNYQGSRSFEFTINPRTISDKEMNLSGYGFTYTGSEIKPDINVTGLESSDFDSSYKDNINVGKATAIATGKGNYKDSLSLIFTINKKSIDLYDINIPSESYEYTGNPITPQVTINDLTQNKDYTVEYSDNINIGTAKITVRGINNFTGQKSINFRIAKAAINITNKTVTMSYTTTVYNRKPQCPKISIENLIENQDYKIEVSNNINAGVATIKITGINDYTGTIVKTFEITKKNISDFELILPAISYEYTGEKIEPEPTIEDLVPNVDYTIFYNDNIDIGVGSVTCKGIGNYEGVLSVTFKITSCDIKEDMVTLSSYTFIYDGTEKLPIVTVEGLIFGTDYAIRYVDNVNAGIGYVAIIGMGNYSGEVDISFTINPQSITSRTLIVEKRDFLYNISPICPEAYISDLRKDIDYEISYYENIAVGTGRIVATGIDNYQGSLTEEFTISVRDIKDCIAKYGSPSIKTIYRVEDGRGLRIYTDATEENQLKLNTDYQINESSEKQLEDFRLVSYAVKGFGGFSGEAIYNFRVVDIEPDTPIDYEDDGVYNYGSIDDNDETAYGNYDFKYLDENSDIVEIPDIGDIDNSLEEELSEDIQEEEIPDIVKDGEDYDFDKFSGMYLDGYDEDNGSNIDDSGNDKKKDPIKPLNPDDGTYNFGDIDEDDETAEGDYDFGDLDEGVDKDSVAKGDYDFNKLAGDVEEWLVAGTEFELDETPMYPTYGATTSFALKSGTYYIYNSSVVNGRVRMARTDAAVEMPARSCGWCKTIDLLNLGQICVGDQVLVSGKIYEYANGSGGYMNYEDEVMYVCEILDKNQYEHPYALANGPKSARIGFANESILSKPEDL